MTDPDFLPTQVGNDVLRALDVLTLAERQRVITCKADDLRKRIAQEAEDMVRECMDREALS